ncbi:MAG TPA: DUF3108 domain-containing protein [Bryobacteraceae bacterium]|nr:DUF3108 domain-containing protein [Bryobacteraceae bacterium]
MRLVALLIGVNCFAWTQTAPAPVPGTPAQSKAAPEAQQPVAAKSKQPTSETLHYLVNWPSGLSLGEATLTSSMANGEWSHSFKVEAAVPGFAVSEAAKSRATSDFCALELHKTGERGKRVVNETTRFDQKSSRATRETSKGGAGGKSELTIPNCAKDALSYIGFVRKELATGRLPQSQQVFYGAGYQVRTQFQGTEAIQVGQQSVSADRIQATIKGPASEIIVDLFFARDDVRTPVRIQVPLTLGKFSMELSR